MVHATVLANAYSVKHMVPSRWKKQHYMRQLNWRTGAFRVYLKHGINDKTRERAAPHRWLRPVPDRGGPSSPRRCG